MELTNKQQELLLKMLKERETVENVKVPADEKTSLRSIAVYKSQFSVFSAFCKANQISQSEALYKAINLFMSTYKK